MHKKLGVFLICFIFLFTSFLFVRQDKTFRVDDVISPVEIVLNGGYLKLSDLDCFDTVFSLKNAELAKKLSISEEDAFIIGNLGKYWASNLLKGRYVYNSSDDLIYLRQSYKEKFKYSGFCLKNAQPLDKASFERRINEIKKTKYQVLDLDSDIVYEINAPEVRKLRNYLVIKQKHLPKNLLKKENFSGKYSDKLFIKSIGNIKVYFTDFTTKIIPDRNCDIPVCQEILNNINNAQKTIDMAIYGYSRTPVLEKALASAQKRGVKIRLVYDSDINGGNIYPDTEIIKQLLPDNNNDINSPEVKSIMHNKFYIFDDKITVTGSANLSHTDMSGFNSNALVVINSEEVAKIYKTEFEQMFSGKFHNDKTGFDNKNVNLDDTEVKIYFSPQDKSITNAIIPLINESEKYIYIPTFVLTDKKLTSALLSAKLRGVDVKIIMDALNASVQHSKHKELRNGGILVKTENYAGKMHSKSMVIDDKYTIIGSMNFSYSGENKNDENIVIIKNPNIAKTYKEFFLYQWSKIDDKWLKFNARAEGKDSIGSCSDGLDNNYDGHTDIDDSACK